MKQSVLASLLACAALAACSTATTKTATAPESTPAAAPVSAAPVAADKLSAAELEARRLAAARSELAKQSVYFEYDKFAVAARYQDVIKQQADFTKATASDVISVEGNADERGSREYNLALGQKRAEAVRKALVSMGVADSRIEAVSFGSEKPRATCHDESCWAENRRVDFAHKDR